jgi:hypothetical protein
MTSRALVLALACVAVCQADLSEALAEPNLEKRSEKAIKLAEQALDHASKAWKDGRDADEAAQLKAVRDGIDLCVQSLKDSGKDARKSPKYFKRAEITLRNIIRRLDSFRFAKGVDERAPLDHLLSHAHRVHEGILLDIMTKGD